MADHQDDGTNGGTEPLTAQAGDRPRRGKTVRRLILGIIVATLTTVPCTAGWLYWTHPTTTSVPLPAGVEEGEVRYLSSALPSPQTIHGNLFPGPLYSRNHEWVGTVTWKPFHGAEQDYELRLGESVHIEGLGTVTLLEVNAPPIIPEINFSKDRKVGGWDYMVNIALDPGLSLCTVFNPCPHN